MSQMRLFDLNIETILEAWTNAHAIRELIANALDEQCLSGTPEVRIYQDGPSWIIRDYGRGLRYENFTQNENPEKLKASGKVIGKFGVGLKDAMATLNRNGVQVEIESAHGIISLVQNTKHGFANVVTLHAAISEPRDPEFQGTAVRLAGIADQDMDTAKGFFLKFSNELVVEETRVGQILQRRGPTGRIYVAGLLIAEEENFAFSYNISALTEPMRKALNRERTNVGRTAYTERVKAMLLQASTQAVATTLAQQIRALETGAGSDEIKWKEVAVHACKILSASGKYLFVTPSQIVFNASAIERARTEGLTIITVPDSIQVEVAGAEDISGTPLRDLATFQAEWNDSFKFDFVTSAQLSPPEREIFEATQKIAALVGGVPGRVKAIQISNTMRADFLSGHDALGIWDPETDSIVIRRDQLRSLQDYAGVLLHEIAHARSGYGDVTRDFENELTHYLGRTAASAIRLETGSPQPPEKASLLKRLLG